MAKRVVTQGGGENLFKITGTNKLEVFIVSGDWFGGKKKIGGARSLEDALSIINRIQENKLKI